MWLFSEIQNCTHAIVREGQNCINAMAREGQNVDLQVSFNNTLNHIRHIASGFIDTRESARQSMGGLLILMGTILAGSGGIQAAHRGALDLQDTVFVSVGVPTIAIGYMLLCNIRPTCRRQSRLPSLPPETSIQDEEQGTDYKRLGP